MGRRSEYRDHRDITEDESADYSHPALKDYSPTVEKVKHVGLGVAKGALYGGATLGAIFAGASAALGAGALMAGGPFTMIPAAIMGVLGIGTGTMMATLGGAAMAGFTTGAVLGGAGNGLRHMFDMNEADERKQEVLINKYEAAKQRSNKLALLTETRDRQAAAMRNQEQQMRGGNPNRGLPNERAVAEGPAYT